MADPVSPQVQIIQGGMGAGVSLWSLAREVSLQGGLGTLSGVAPYLIMADALGRGDPGGHYRKALAAFPFQKVAKEVLKNFYIDEKDPRGRKPRAVPFFTVEPSDLLIALTICSSYAFVWLAKNGHGQGPVVPVSFNLLTKIEMPIMYSLLGAILAGVDYVTMGAGIPIQIPDLLSDIVAGRPLSYRISLAGSKEKYTMVFDPKSFFGGILPPLKRPGFLPIISSNVLAKVLIKRLPAGSIQGFIIETWVAGGHNAPPRRLKKDAQGNPLPLYDDEEDKVDYLAMVRLGIPFWIGGGCASPEMLRWALSVGASGIQVGSIFALSRESGFDPSLRKRIVEAVRAGKAGVKTDMLHSPTGFPFKVLQLEGTAAHQPIGECQARQCLYGVLLTPYQDKPDQPVRYHCPSEPVEDYLRKGGKFADTTGRFCLCSELMAAIGIGKGLPVVTLGDDLSFLDHLLDNYGVPDVFRFLLGK
ncbi:MAG: nitronate monooxygenase [Candidatus Paceibacterota bacterium]